jgi:7,8-dihydropterin-6-yl-methyl-4-(beta-D-ribofuranosyl)aminobenzene 5'-phosphate synthase
MKAKVLSVYDEGSLPGTPLIGAKGLSILVDVDDERTLFDTGMRGNYLMHNMSHLEADPSAVDRVIISHMHSAHIGGLQSFLEAREHQTDVIAPQDHGGVREIRVLGIPMKRTGFPKMPPETYAKMNITAISEWTQLSEHLFVTGKIPEGINPGLHENSLVMMTRAGPVLICGCCHQGLAETISYVEKRTNRKVSAVIGGTHLMHMKKAQAHAAAEMLRDIGQPMLYLSHCSGNVQKTYLREKLGMKAVRDFYVGTEIQFDI